MGIKLKTGRYSAGESLFIIILNSLKRTRKSALCVRPTVGKPVSPVPY